MKIILFTILLTLAVMKITAQGEIPKPIVGYSQIVKLAQGKKTKSVLKGSGLKKFCYSYKKRYLGCGSYGYNVQYVNNFMPFVPLTDDAFGISYCNAGSGCWEIVFKDKTQVEAYKKEALKNGFHPLHEE